MATNKVTVQTGNLVYVLLDNARIGMIQSLRAGDDYGQQEVSEIGNIHVVEYVPTLARHTLTAAVVSLKAESLESDGVAPENGDEVLQGRVFDVSVIDKTTGNELRRYINCTFASGDMEVTRHQVIVRNVTLLATDVRGKFKVN
jgi:hypothetical protein